MLACNCPPSLNWKKNLDDATIAKFQKELGSMSYKLQFITLAGFHSLNYGMFDLAHGYARRRMSALVELQEKEFAAVDRGFTAVKHQREVGTGYFDTVTQTIQQGQSSTTSLTGSTEEQQFKQATRSSTMVREVASPTREVLRAPCCISAWLRSMHNIKRWRHPMHRLSLPAARSRQYPPPAGCGRHAWRDTAPHRHR